MGVATPATIKKGKGRVGMNSGPAVALELMTSSRDEEEEEEEEEEDPNTENEFSKRSDVKGLFERLERIENELEDEIANDEEKEEEDCLYEEVAEEAEVTFKPSSSSPNSKDAMICPPSSEMRDFAYSLMTSPPPKPKNGGKSPSPAPPSTPVIIDIAACEKYDRTPTPAKLMLDEDVVEHQGSPEANNITDSGASTSPIGNPKVVSILKEGMLMTAAAERENVHVNDDDKEGGDSLSYDLYRNAGIVAGVSSICYLVGWLLR